MRKITELTAKAFRAGLEMKMANSYTDGKAYWLHGNKIFWKVEGTEYHYKGIYQFNMCSWGSPTTRERINGLLKTLELPYRIFQKNHEQFLSCPNMTYKEMYIEDNKNVEVSQSYVKAITCADNQVVQSVERTIV